ncbi:MAG: peptidyl-prolyl cis-trans isomerase [Candidatus Hydrothermae bacterium]|nr:peptidyl-prolyl cis-trans isomerase [Candidatus Hydrothermae bacterium]
MMSWMMMLALTAGLVDQARSLVNAKQYDAARTLYREALKQESRFRGRVLAELGRLELLYLNEADSALVHLELARGTHHRKDSLRAEIEYLLGLTYEAKRMYPQAAEAYERVALQYPRHPRAADALEAAERVFKKAYPEWVALVDHEPITRVELEEILNRMPPLQKRFYQSRKGRKQLIDQLVFQRLLWLAARDAGYDERAQVMEAVERARQNAMMRALYEDSVRKQVQISDVELKARYKRERDRFRVPAQVDLRRVVVKDSAKAMEILRAIQQGASMDSLARALSVAAEGKSGGLLRGLTRRSKPKPMIEAAFSMKVGEVRMLRLPSGEYAVIRVEKRTPERYRSLDEVRAALEAELRREKEEQLREALKMRLAERYGVKTEEELKKTAKKDEGKASP